ncbi:MAG TPA: NHL repeat-containing protein [Candidatus Sulfotelmatobacter sp.]|nr:NHL repeat-containing protein [Candidatus Sulfotelmatobacter sp.]
MKATILALLILATILPKSFADSVYVWCGDGTVHGYLTNGITIAPTNNFSGWNGPIGLTFDNLGDLYIGVPGDSYIWLFYPTDLISLFGNVDSISSLAFNTSGELIGAIPNYANVQKLPFTSEYITLPTPYNTNNANANNPDGLALDSSDNIYVANNYPPYEITIISNNFSSGGIFTTSVNSPWGLAFDSSGNLFVANSGTNGLYENSISKFATNGTLTTFATSSSGLNQPCGIAFDSSGNLFVANSGAGNILKFTPLGGVSVFASGLTAPTSIAIYPGKNVYSAKPMSLADPVTQTNSIQLNLTEPVGLNFTVLVATNLLTPASNWVQIGTFTELSTNFSSYPYITEQSVYYQFTDTNAANYNARFYRVSSP